VEAYRLVADRWGELPSGLAWGSNSAIDVAPDGRSVWVAERCGGDNCIATPDRPPIFHFDLDGKLLHAFGQGLLVAPHGIDVDHQGNVWVTDGADNRPRGANAQTPAKVIGHQVFKFSPTGEVLMVLGAPGGDDATAAGLFWQPNDVQVAPNGDVYVAEGHSSAPGATPRILKFDPEGRLLREWGSLGTGPGEFDTPHALAMDSQGRLFVADRGNNRIQVFTPDGEYVRRPLLDRLRIQRGAQPGVAQGRLHR
jgi:sugar lactone lactonase YvrE